MSWKATSYVKELRQYPDGSPLDARAKLVFMVLADYHNTAHKSAWPSLPLLAAESLTSTRQVKRVLDAGSEHGLLTVKHPESGRGKGLEYSFLELDSEQKKDDKVTPFLEQKDDKKDDIRVTNPICHKEELEEPVYLNRLKTLVSVPLLIDSKLEEIYEAHPRYGEDRKDSIRAIANATWRLIDVFGSVADALEFLLRRTLLYRERIGFPECWPDERQKFIPMVATWFNKERYSDAESKWQRPSGGTGKSDERQQRTLTNIAEAATAIQRHVAGEGASSVGDRDAEGTDARGSGIVLVKTARSAGGTSQGGF